jgi:ribosomal protein L3
MSVGLFAKKLGMTQIFDESGVIFPVTLLKQKNVKLVK